MEATFQGPHAGAYLIGFVIAGLLFVVLGFWLRAQKRKSKISLPTGPSEFKGLSVPTKDLAKSSTPNAAEDTTNKAAANASLSSATALPSQSAPPRASWWDALSKTREKFFKFSGGDVQALREALEEACLVSDLGVSNTQDALSALNWGDITNAPESERLGMAKGKLSEVIFPWIKSSSSINHDWISGLESKVQGPKVIWFVGVNGVGKTTSIAKLASELKSKGKSVLLAAGDTFRAAASEQLEIWAERLEIDCVRGQAGADSSAVLFDAIEKAKAKNIDFVLCDSAGRLHNQGQLMEALRKNRRVMEKACPTAPHEVLLVLDANTGQNMINQAEQFVSAVGVTGLILTKLDGTARGGAVIAVARKTSLPIRRLGLGEGREDFIAFDAEQFSKALLGMER